MKRKFFSSLLYALLIGGAVSSFTACKDYDDDITSLRTQINKNTEAIKEINALIANGGLITSVEKFNDSEGSGILVKMSNGTLWKIFDGKDGQDGRNADVWTIDSEGYWCLNGTRYVNPVDGKYIRAIGEKGEDGKDADIWTIDTEGYWCLNGTRYVNPETGEWFKVTGENGKDANVWTIDTEGYWCLNGTRYVNPETGEWFKAVGETGKDGEDGNVWTIDTDGYWCLNGERYINPATGTWFKATGENGEDGNIWTIDTDGYWCLNGTRYINPATGTYVRAKAETSIYYKPVPEKGGFEKYVDGLPTGEIIEFNFNSITAVKDENYLTIRGLVDGEGNALGDIKIRLTPMVTGFTFIPENYFAGIAGVQVGVIDYYEWTVDGDGVEKGETISHSGDNEFTVSYWMNSGTALADMYRYSFVTKDVKTRAAAVYVTQTEVKDGQVIVSGVYNGGSIEKGVVPAFALQYTEDDVVVTSDYAALHVSNKDLTKLGLWWNYAPATRGAIIVEEEWDGELPTDFKAIVEGQPYATIYANETTKLSELFVLKNGETVINPADLGLEYDIQYVKDELDDPSVDINKLEITPKDGDVNKDPVIRILVKEPLIKGGNGVVAAGYIKLHIAK